MTNTNIPQNIELINNDTYIARLKFGLDTRFGYKTEVHVSDSESGVFVLDQTTQEAIENIFINGDNIVYVKLRTIRITDSQLSSFGPVFSVDLTKVTPLVKKDLDDSGTSREASLLAAAAPFVDASWELSLEDLGSAALRKIKKLSYTFVAGAGGQTNEKFRISSKQPTGSSFTVLAERTLSVGLNTEQFGSEIQIERDSDLRIEFFADAPDAAATFELNDLAFIEYSNTPFNA